MNTADRSLAMVDYALRRRFAFQTLQPQFLNKKFHACLEERGVRPDLIKMIIDRMTALNQEIAADKIRLGPGYQIGHSFFVPPKEVLEVDVSWYRRVVRSEIAPLLEEYWFDNAEKADTWKSKLLQGIN